MARPNDNAPRAPFIEPLESRQLFAATPLPDLVPKLTTTLSAVLQPGANITPKLQITNNGAAIAKKTYVPIRLYISPTRTLAPGATPFKTIQTPLTLAAGQSTNVDLPATLPSTINSKRYFIIVQLNNREALAESNTKNNIVTSTRLANPVGTYSGPTLSTLGRRGTLSLDISPNSDPFSTTASLVTDFTFTLDGVRTHLTHLKSKISAAGVYRLKTNGTFMSPSRGKTGYRLVIKATLSGNTLTGKVKFIWQSNTDSRNTNSSFTLTRG